jgi:hypothetical protein
MRKASKAYFSQEEDTTLEALVKKYGTDKWKTIAKILKTKSARQVRERWEGYLAPNIKKEEWTVDEDQLLRSKVNEFGKRWKFITRFLDGRTDGQCKNRYNRLLRSERKRSSILVPDSENHLSKAAESASPSMMESGDTLLEKFDFFGFDLIPFDPSDEAWMQGSFFFESESEKSRFKNFLVLLLNL